MQGVKGIASEKQIELFAWSNKLVKSRNLWERRLGLVLLTHFVKDRNSRTQIEKTKWRQRALRQKGSRMASKRFTEIASQFLIHFILKFEKSTAISQFSFYLGSSITGLLEEIGA